MSALYTGQEGVTGIRGYKTSGKTMPCTPKAYEIVRDFAVKHGLPMYEAADFIVREWKDCKDNER